VTLYVDNPAGPRDRPAGRVSERIGSVRNGPEALGRRRRTGCEGLQACEGL